MPASDFLPAREMEDYDWRGAVVDLDAAIAAMRAGDNMGVVRFVRLYGAELRELMDGNNAESDTLRTMIDEAEKECGEFKARAWKFEQAIMAAKNALEADAPDAEEKADNAFDILDAAL